jgi:hypothetical protein
MRAIVNKGIQPLWQLFVRLQFALHWAVQSVMAHVRTSPHTGLPGAFTYPLRAAAVVVRPKFV